MKKQEPVYDIRTATAEDIPELLTLQANNQISRGGALSIEFPATWFADVIRDMPIVTAWREHRLVGFLVSSSKECVPRWPERPIISDRYALLPPNAGKVWRQSCSRSNGCFCRAARVSLSFVGITRRRARLTASMAFWRWQSSPMQMSSISWRHIGRHPQRRGRLVMNVGPPGPAPTGRL